jgi:integrase
MALAADSRHLCYLPSKFGPDITGTSSYAFTTIAVGNSYARHQLLEDSVAVEPTSSLLVPSFRSGTEGRLVELRKLFDRVAIRGGWSAGDIRSRALRHTYCSARLMTLDGGVAVSTFQVAREMGHGGDSLVRRIYGHLGEIRHRSEAVEYRVEQHAATLGDRLAVLRTL